MEKTNSNKKARLDYFIVANYLMDIIPEIKIRYGHRSDHSIIELKIHLSKFQRGPWTWKLNLSLLKTKSYVELINTKNEQTVEEYIIPVYNPLNIPTNKIILTIDDTLFLDTVLMKIRGISIHFGSKEKKIKIYKNKSW